MGTKWKNPVVWFRGILAAFVGGGAGAVASGFVAIAQTPAQYNINEGLGNLLRMIGSTFLVTGILNAMHALQKSPLPEVEETDTIFIDKK